MKIKNYYGIVSKLLKHIQKVFESSLNISRSRKKKKKLKMRYFNDIL